uniref:Uncharacterized protein n=1 Tax=viral metagenome TaxID=1070528 RepID=A0A6C0HUG1_9ZZZZ
MMIMVYVDIYFYICPHFYFNFIGTQGSGKTS